LIAELLRGPDAPAGSSQFRCLAAPEHGIAVGTPKVRAVPI
jgi:hypothetical protein